MDSVIAGGAAEASRNHLSYPDNMVILVEADFADLRPRA